jgi:TIR domain
MAGGHTISLDAAKQIPLQVGDLAVTTAGTLPARFIFHAVTLGPGGATTSTEEIIRGTTAKCLALLTAGSEWGTEIDRHLDSARVILVLLSADFIGSDYCYGVEMTRALERHWAADACVIPVILRAVDCTHSPLGQLQALPRDAKPVTSWPDQDSAFLDVTEGIRAALRQLAAK